MSDDDDDDDESSGSADEITSAAKDMYMHRMFARQVRIAQVNCRLRMARVLGDT